MPSIEEKRREFLGLHENGCFAIPNPCDIGTVITDPGSRPIFFAASSGYRVTFPISEFSKTDT